MEVVLDLIQTAVLLLTFLGTVHLLGREKRAVRAVLFAFAVVSVLLSNLYWLAYNILRPDTRMPFAANEIGELAMFLLFGAVFRTQTEHPAAKREMLFAALFTAANAALWIAWSGEWADDVLTGAAFGYFLCCLTGQIKQTGVFPAWERRVLGAACPVLIAAQTAIFFVPEPMKRPLDLFCYFLLFAVDALLLLRAVQSLRKGSRSPSPVSEAFAANAWATITMYMSSGGFYAAAMLLSALSFPMMLLALKKEVDGV